MNDDQQDRVISYVLGQMNDQETSAFLTAVSQNPELQEAVRQASDDLAGLALLTKAVPPPEDLLHRIMRALPDASFVGMGNVVSPTLPSPEQEQDRVTSGPAWFPWSLAACLAVVCGVLGYSQIRTQHELTKVLQENEISQMRIATLASQVDSYSKVAAVVIWDVRQQRGVAELNQLPPLDQEHDYQLWLIDPHQPSPVSGGLVTVAPDGSARVVFQPALTIENASQFAVSIEPKGGGIVPRGQIVLAGK